MMRTSLAVMGAGGDGFGSPRASWSLCTWRASNPTVLSVGLAGAGAAVAGAGDLLAVPCTACRAATARSKQATRAVESCTDAQASKASDCCATAAVDKKAITTAVQIILIATLYFPYGRPRLISPTNIL